MNGVVLKEINYHPIHKREGSRMSFYALIPTFLVLASINTPVFKPAWLSQFLMTGVLESGHKV
jgi:hypothetical protein